MFCWFVAQIKSWCLSFWHVDDILGGGSFYTSTSGLFAHIVHYSDIIASMLPCLSYLRMRNVERVNGDPNRVPDFSSISSSLRTVGDVNRGVELKDLLCFHDVDYKGALYYMRKMQW